MLRSSDSDANWAVCAGRLLSIFFEPITMKWSSDMHHAVQSSLQSRTVMSAFHNDISGFQPRTHAPANTCLKPDIYILMWLLHMTTEMKVNVFKMFITCDNKKIFGKTFGNRLVHTCAEEYKLSFPLSYHTYTYHASTGKQSILFGKSLIIIENP